MKLDQILEAKYHKTIDVDVVLGTLIAKYNEATGENTHVNMIEDERLSKKRAEIIARYAVTVIVPEIFEETDSPKLLNQAQKLRSLPNNISLKQLKKVVCTAAHVAPDAADVATAYYAADVADAAAYAADVADADADAAADAAFDVAEVANYSKRPAYHLNQMIKLCMGIQ